MKKMIRAICALIAIGMFILATQISCQKSTAQTNGNSVVTANLILFGKNIQVPGTTTDSSGYSIKVWNYQFYLANLDGSNQRTIPIAMPSGLYVAQAGYLTPDRHTIVFAAYNQPATVHQVYSCSIDGSNLKKLLDIDGNTQLLGAY